MFGPGEYDRARSRVVERHGELWAEWLDGHRTSLEYGPEFCRAIADDVSRAFVSLGKGAPDSAQYWADSADKYRADVLTARAMADRRKSMLASR